jgi:hypothetical protein
MTLRARLSRLEAQRHKPSEVPRVIIFKTVWADDDGNLQALSELAHVRTVTGWQSINRDNGEPEETFRLRAEAMAA